MAWPPAKALPSDLVTLRVGNLHVTRSEITRSQFIAVVGEHKPLWAIHPEPVEGEDRGLLPATHVSWYDAIRYANALSIAQDLNPVYEIDGDAVKARRNAGGWRLPTDAEWLKAARLAGDNADQRKRTNAVLPVCSPKTPPDRLCDLATNAIEWIDEREKADQGDPWPEATARGCALRNGEDPWEKRCGLRPGTQLPGVGFRLVRPTRRSREMSVTFPPGARPSTGGIDAFNPHSL